MQWMKNLVTALFISLSLTAFAAEPQAPTVINLNTASVEQLSTLKGIGKTKAEAIVQYRDTHGKFSSLNELTEVKGIGAGLIEKNRALLALE